MKILIGHESSGEVREAFRARGHDAWSCDLQDADDGSPYHIVGDVFDHLRGDWDAFGFHPTCTFMCGSGLHWNNRGRGWEKTEKSVAEVRRLMAVEKPFYLENPVGIIGTRIRKPTQTIQPYDFGEDASKRTCLWLQGFPRLRPTLYVAPRWVCQSCKGVVPPVAQKPVSCPHCDVFGVKLLPRWGNQTDSGQNRLGPSELRWKLRSKTYPGIAQAMAAQWGTPAELALTA